MRIAVYNHHWPTAGGGEKYVGWIASALAARHDVELLTEAPIDRLALHERLGIDLGAVGDRVVAGGVPGLTDAARDYDLLVNGSFASDLPCTASSGLYVVHFPAVAMAEERRRSLWERAAARLWRRTASDDPVAPGFLAGYDRLVANSEYTRGWIAKRWGRDAQVVYPAVAPLGPGEKRKIILSVGRFFSPERGHCKKQLELVEAFRRLYRSGVGDWEYHLVGGCDPEDTGYLDQVRAAASDLPIHLHVDASGEHLQALYASAQIFWHGAGVGEDPDRRPERLEHFGIATVEAMSAGCVPIVYVNGGPAEVVEQGRSGWLFADLDELVDRTRELIADRELRARMAAAARRRASAFAPEVAACRLYRVVEGSGSAEGSALAGSPNGGRRDP